MSSHACFGCYQSNLTGTKNPNFHFRQFHTRFFPSWKFNVSSKFSIFLFFSFHEREREWEKKKIKKLIILILGNRFVKVWISYIIHFIISFYYRHSTILPGANCIIALTTEHKTIFANTNIFEWWHKRTNVICVDSVMACIFKLFLARTHTHTQT